MGNNRDILLCAGGTGGHLFPAQALAMALSAKGWVVHLATDARAQQFVKGFEPEQIHIIRSATLGGKNPLGIAKAVINLGAGYWKSRALLKTLRPVCVIGFGGYPTVPPILAASRQGIPIILHEQNAVMGRANRFLHQRAQVVVMGFGVCKKSDDDRFLTLGNPVRAEVLDAAKKEYKVRKKTDEFNLLVFGGSQGAQYFSKIIPEAIALLDRDLRTKLRIVQQARVEDEQELRSRLGELNIQADIAPFFSAMAKHISGADFVISRGGASTVSELAVIGRPSILVPYPFALDHDQAMNAAELERAGGCKVIKQADLQAQYLADELKLAIEQPELLATIAKKAKATGKPEATEKFAKLVEHIISDRSFLDFPADR
ncbi:MAG: undecaprenyldiphospho-muramoylpentapeptide beta-N-acetylglucosaminyltransferase [Hyphomicrobiales bacterium]|nr:undecaprenyldiphospho-muramoylpentapeptide beta-N-acetylglucosaminyltransferase [Hyphomicrobiales bacterium]